MNQTDWLKVESIELEAQGVAHNAEGKVVFIDGALPGEIVKAQSRAARTTGSRASSPRSRRKARCA